MPDFETANTVQLPLNSSGNDMGSDISPLQRKYSQQLFVTKKEASIRISQCDKSSKKSEKPSVEIPIKKTLSGQDANPQNTEDSEETLVKVQLTEEELDEKIKGFGGLNNELDASVRDKIGKLLVNEEDEAINASWETYEKIFKIIGGWKMIFYIVILTIVLKFWSVYEQRIQQEYASTDPEKQPELHFAFMKQIGCVLSLGIIVRNLKDLWMRNKKRYMSQDITKSTLQKILEAPVNLFFDVTPIGKILDIFNGDINVFRGEILDPFSHCMEMLSHIIVVISMMLSIGSWEVFFGFAIMITLMFRISKPYLHADN